MAGKTTEEKDSVQTMDFVVESIGSVIRKENLTSLVGTLEKGGLIIGKVTFNLNDSFEFKKEFFVEGKTYRLGLEEV